MTRGTVEQEVEEKEEAMEEEEEGEGEGEEEFPPQNIPRNLRKLSMKEMGGPLHEWRVSDVKNFDILQNFV